MTKTEHYIKALTSVFASSRDKREANARCTQIMADMAGDAGFFSEALKDHIQKPGSLNTLHYPTVGLDIELNKYFGLVANCWIPLPDKATNISTKAIHHHGDMLLTTATAFGPGYEHWTFETPSVVDADREIYELKVLEQAPHPLHHVAFVDAYVAHLPLYPPDLTVTYALWSSRFPTTWKDSLKRMPFVRDNSIRLRDLGARFGLASKLELKVVEYFDFYPTADGFRGIRERREFERTNNDDYLASLFQVIQETGNQGLAPVIGQKLDSGEQIDNRAAVKNYLTDLDRGTRIEGRVSPTHYGVEYANFSKDQILHALEVQNGEN